MAQSSTTVFTAKPKASKASAVDEDAVVFLESRGISLATLVGAPVGSGTVKFPDLGRKARAVFFGYKPGQWKARAIEEKAFVASPGFESQFWNLPAVLECLSTGPADIYITEGEIDALSLMEAGIPPYQVLSLPAGAGKPTGEFSEPPGYLTAALAEGLSAASKIVWCGDTDKPGLAMREWMAQCFGPAKFSFADWPEGCKDPNDVLLKHGADALRNAAFAAKVWPAYGLFTLSALPEPPPLAPWEVGFENLNEHMKLAPRTLSVVTGHPGHGKSTVFQQIWFNIVSAYGVKIAMASFETRPKPHIRRQIRTLFSNAPEHMLSEEEKAAGDAFIEKHYLWLQHPEQRPTLEWFLDQAEIAVIRHGARVLFLDPWNRVESTRDTRRETETEYILRCLRACYVFAQDMNVHMQIVAHPAKMDGPRKKMAPELEDISGSKHWDNLVDQGFVVHRPALFNKDGSRRTDALFICRKSRFMDELGYPFQAKIRYDLDRRIYVPNYDPDEEEE